MIYNLILTLAVIIGASIYFRYNRAMLPLYLVYCAAVVILFNLIRWSLQP